MTYKLFAAIHAGSEEVSMKIYEISKRNGIRLIDTAVHYTELGSDTYLKGYIGYELVNELCDVLESFKMKMKEYQVIDYAAYASSAIGEASNKNIIIDRIKVRTGITLIPIDNSEQFFLKLRSVALGMPDFRQLTGEGAAIVDMGGGSLELTVYDKGRLIFAQNLKLGSLRIREILADLEGRSTDFISVMNDYIGNDIDTLSKLFMIDHHVRHLIIGGNGIRHAEPASVLTGGNRCIARAHHAALAVELSIHDPGIDEGTQVVDVIPQAFALQGAQNRCPTFV